MSQKTRFDEYNDKFWHEIEAHPFCDQAERVSSENEKRLRVAGLRMLTDDLIWAREPMQKIHNRLRTETRILLLAGLKLKYNLSETVIREISDEIDREIIRDLLNGLQSLRN